MSSPWPHDDLASKIKFFGKPGTNLVSIIPPFQMYYDRHPIKSITVNQKIAASLLRVFNDIFEQCEHDQKKVDALGVSAYGGCYNYRPVRGSSNLSNHAFGAAIDLDPERHPLGKRGGPFSKDKIVVNAFKKEGWLWGGDYKSRADEMHMEAVSR